MMRPLRLLLTLLLACGPIAAGYAQSDRPWDPACNSGRAEAYLDVGNVRARIFNNGGLFWRGSPDVYEVPKGSGVNALFHTNLWVGGMVGDELRFAGSMYGPYDFWPGPLTAEGHTPFDCSVYDRIFEVTRTDLERYDQTGEVTANLRDWPWYWGAPVIDGDGVADNYNLEGGDRPALVGDQMQWWVMNNADHENYLGAWAVGIEVQGTAFAFAHLRALGNTTFYRYKITYRGEEPLEETYVGLHVDPDLGNFQDDYIGSDLDLEMAFVYNADNDDDRGGYGEAPPALGISFLQGPLVDHDGQDNNKNGKADEPEERLGLASFIWPSRYESDAMDYYRLAQAQWRDGQPLTLGGIGRDFSTIPTRFLFPGDPVTHAFWSEMNYDNQDRPMPSGDRRFVISTGPFSMQPGDTQDVTLAIVWSRGKDHLDSVRQLREDMALIQGAADEILTPRLLQVQPDPPERFELGFAENYPNPFRERTTIQYTVSDPSPVRLVVYDVLGRAVAVLVQAQQEAGRYEVEIDGTVLVPGLYVYRLEIGPASATRTMVRLP